MTRIGIGYDVHKLEKGELLYIGGIHISSDVGSVGHSDGDALSHATVSYTHLTLPTNREV